MIYCLLIGNNIHKRSESIDFFVVKLNNYFNNVKLMGIFHILKAFLKKNFYVFLIYNAEYHESQLSDYLSYG